MEERRRGSAHLGRTGPSWASAHGLKHGVAVDGDAGVGVADAEVSFVTVLDWLWVQGAVSEGQRAGQDPTQPRSSSFPLLSSL